MSYVCDICDSTYTTNFNLKRHQNAKHNPEFKKPQLEHLCMACTKYFSSIRSLRRHGKSCKGDIDPLQCRYCLLYCRNQPAKSRHTTTCDSNPINKTKKYE